MKHLREHWGSRLGFMVAAIGSAIGLGVLWKFPYVTGINGGGLFLLAYAFCLFILGVPLFMAEVVMGRASQSAAVGAFQKLGGSHAGGWKIGGYLGVLASFLIMSFYSVIAGWGLCFVVMSMLGFYHGKSLDQVGAVFDLLAGSGPISLFWHALFTAITVGIVFLGVRKGIESWSKVLVKLLFVLLVGLVIYNFSLPGFEKALSFIFTPRLADFKTSSLLEALGLAFFTLSLGQGIMISYGSYIQERQKIHVMSIVIALSVFVAAILASLLIFPVIFSFGLSTSMGPGLVFKTLPYLFAQLPGSLFLSTLFFLLFVFTALTSAIPLIEVVATNIMELFDVPRPRAVVSVGIAAFIFGIPSAFAYSGWPFYEWQEIFGKNFLETIDALVSEWVIPVAGLITALFVGWRIDPAVLSYELDHDGGLFSRKLFNVWYFLIRYIIPLTIFLIILERSEILSL